MRSIHSCVTIVLIVAGAAPPSQAAVDSASASGEAVFRRVCAVCHLGLAQIQGVATADAPVGTAPRAVPREILHQYPPEAILNTLVNGKMQAQGALLTPAEQRAVAQFASGRRFGEKPIDPAKEAGTACTEHPPFTDPARGPSWNGWGNGVTNARFQSLLQGGIAAADLAHLKLKWAFGYANVSSVRAQPAVASGRVFVASENGQVHALNAKSGCTYWTFKAQAGIGAALSVGPYKRPGGAPGYAVYFGDRKANAYAVDAETGTQIWTAKIETHPAASITGSPTLYAGRVLVPIQGIAEEGRGGHGDYPCCTFRGSLTALDASTGAVLWKTYTISENRPRAKTAAGVQTYGPAGGGIWSAPTVDARRKLVYVGTGNGYAEPLQSTTDAVMALDLETGVVRWVQQVLEGDVWAMGCDARNHENPQCPQTLGPDFDFSASPVLMRVGAREFLVIPQKSGMAYGLDPAKQGAILWRYRFGQGSGLGGEWGAAVEGDRAYIGVGDVLTPSPGGVHAVRVSDGQRLWHMPPPQALCGSELGCNVGQGAAVTAIPGAVLSTSLDGGLRGYSARDGSLLWTYDTNHRFKTVNGIEAHGGSMDGAGPIVAGGMLYVNSGNGGFVGRPGNVLLAFGLN